MEAIHYTQNRVSDGRLRIEGELSQVDGIPFLGSGHVWWCSGPGGALSLPRGGVPGGRPARRAPPGQTVPVSASSGPRSSEAAGHRAGPRRCPRARGGRPRPGGRRTALAASALAQLAESQEGSGVRGASGEMENAGLGGQGLESSPTPCRPRAAPLGSPAPATEAPGAPRSARAEPAGSASARLPPSHPFPPLGTGFAASRVPGGLPGAPAWRGRPCAPSLVASSVAVIHAQGAGAGSDHQLPGVRSWGSSSRA